MTVTWFPWDLYGNWLNRCNLIKVLGGKQQEIWEQWVNLWLKWKKMSNAVRASLTDSTLTCWALLKMVGLAPTWQEGHILCREPPLFLLQFHSYFVFTSPSLYQFFMVSWIPFWSIFSPFSDPIPLPFSLFICLNPLIPKPLCICLPASPSSSLTLLPLITPITLVWRGEGSSLLCLTDRSWVQTSPRGRPYHWPSLALLSGSLLFLAALFASGSLQSPVYVCMCVCICVFQHIWD